MFSCQNGSVKRDVERLVEATASSLMPRPGGRLVSIGQQDQKSKELVVCGLEEI